MISLSSFLIVAAILFTIGVLGIFLNRRNVIIMLMAIELMLLAVNLNFIAFPATSATWRDRSSCSSS
jgi:NADH-quinone oxidoreductase subunit K